MDNVTIAVLATVVGFAIPMAMLVKYALEYRRAYRVSRRPDAEFLELFVNGKDYSVDLRTINNGGSKKISSARRELERCGDIILDIPKHLA